MENKKSYTKGYFIEMGIVIGLPAGIPVGLVLGNIAFGPLIGLVIGLTIGIILEKTKNKNPVELDEKNKETRKKIFLTTFIGGAALLLGIIAILYNN